MRLWRRKPRWSERDVARALAIMAADEDANPMALTWYAASPEEEAAIGERYGGRVRVVPVYPLRMATRG